MIEHARISSQSHEFHFNERLGVESCTQAICDLALRFGEGADGEESIMSRPFGVALLIAGFDEEGPSLYTLLTFTPVCLLLTRYEGITPNPQEPTTATTPKPLAPAAKAHKPNSKTNSISLSHLKKRKC